jgi:hypothetical protein
MNTLMKPGEEVTGRIRWEQPVLSLWGYVAGETELSTFTIRCPEGGEIWTLTSSLPGQRKWRLSDRAPDALRKAAEGWLAEFAATVTTGKAE